MIITLHSVYRLYVIWYIVIVSCFFSILWLTMHTCIMTLGIYVCRSTHKYTSFSPLSYHNYDRTCKESLYSTYPYLTYSNKKPSSPVMKKHSMLGYREKINIKALLPSVVAKSSVEKSFPLDARVCILSRPPSPPNKPKTTRHYTFTYIKRYRILCTYKIRCACLYTYIYERCEKSFRVKRCTHLGTSKIYRLEQHSLC